MIPGPPIVSKYRPRMNPGRRKMIPGRPIALKYWPRMNPGRRRMIQGRPINSKYRDGMNPAGGTEPTGTYSRLSGLDPVATLSIEKA